MPCSVSVRKGRFRRVLGFSIVWMGLVHLAPAQVVITGAMRNTMFNGQLAGLIDMDSICGPGAYGLGPLEYLRGELLVLDGHCYVSTATSDSTMKVEERRDVSAPFFVHQRVKGWIPVELPDSVIDLAGIDAFLTAAYGALGIPFAFKLTGIFKEIDVHIVDVPPGTEVHGPDDAHRGNKRYHILGAEAEAIGFFSTRHKAVFTHHDTNIHMHAITADRGWMGHVEAITFDARAVRLEVALR